MSRKTLMLMILAGTLAGGLSAYVATRPPGTCSDGVQSQGETDIDCGGAVCGKCVLGFMCLVNGDCATGTCIGNFCRTVVATYTVAWSDAGTPETATCESARYVYDPRCPLVTESPNASGEGCSMSGVDNTQTLGYPPDGGYATAMAVYCWTDTLAKQRPETTGCKNCHSKGSMQPCYQQLPSSVRAYSYVQGVTPRLTLRTNWTGDEPLNECWCGTGIWTTAGRFLTTGEATNPANFVRCDADAGGCYRIPCEEVGTGQETGTNLDPRCRADGGQ